MAMLCIFESVEGSLVFDGSTWEFTILCANGGRFGGLLDV